MAREPKHRDWIKLHVKECLIGSMREDMTPEERSVWYDFLVLAGNSRVPGVLCSNKEQGFTTKRISQLLNTPEPLIKKCIKTWKGDRIEVDHLKRIVILNWDKYQYSDYDRQKPYRQRSILERNQQYLKEHPKKVLVSTGDDDYDEIEDHKPLARGNDTLEEHEAAMLEANPHLGESLPD